MLKEQFNFELVDIYTPDVVIRKSMEQIEEATKGYVVGNIERYDGPISSYTKQVGWGSALGTMKSETVMVDIQDQLGEQAKEYNKFEVFLTVRGLEHYKYRMMFVGYSTISYPVTIVMNEDLAVSYTGRMNTTFTIDSMRELEQMIDIVVNSDQMISLLQSLINESMRQLAKKEIIK